MQLQDIMTGTVESVTPNCTVQRAAEKMCSCDVGFLPVVDENNRPIGVVTDRDITIRAVAQGLDPQQTTVHEVMTDDVCIMRFDDQVDEATDLMKDKQIRRILVKDANNCLVGVVSLGDVAIQTSEPELSGETLEAISEPAR